MNLYLKQNFNFNDNDFNKLKALKNACQYGNMKIVKYLVEEKNYDPMRTINNPEEYDHFLNHGQT